MFFKYVLFIFQIQIKVQNEDIKYYILSLNNKNKYYPNLRYN